jgi:fructose-bisphosphate aldolase / 2-amino-3,7-dideoxy-D-threo-hept-6-ulosonate synthase
MKEKFMIGKTRRLDRILVGDKKRCLLSPLDHAGWLGPVKGLDRPKWIVDQVVAGGANAILAGPGFIRATASSIPATMGIVLRLSITAGLSKQGTQETPIASLDTALQMDADAVAVSVFFGRDGDIEIYSYLADLIQACSAYDMPVIAEMMPPEDRSFKADAIAHAARIGMEMGADIIKTNYCGNVDEFRKVVESVPLPIIVAGGPKHANEPSLASFTRDAIAGGAVGVAIGRRVWQSDNPSEVTKQIYQALHEG